MIPSLTELCEGGTCECTDHRGQMSHKKKDCDFLYHLSSPPHFFPTDGVKHATWTIVLRKDLKSKNAPQAASPAKNWTQVEQNEVTLKFTLKKE